MKTELITTKLIVVSLVAAAVVRISHNAGGGGLEPDARYTLTDMDTGHVEQLAGHHLMQEGLPITIRQRPSAPVVLYRKVR